MQEMVDVKDLTEEQLQRLMLQVLNGETTLQEVKGLSDDHMEAIYGVGYNLYSAGRNQDASKVFVWLALYNPFKSKYWLGLGASLQMDKGFEQALQAYSMAAITGDVNDPAPHIHAAECYLGLGNLDEAKTALSTAIRMGGEDARFANSVDRAKALLGILEEKAHG